MEQSFPAIEEMDQGIPYDRATWVMCTCPLDQVRDWPAQRRTDAFKDLLAHDLARAQSEM